MQVLVNNKLQVVKKGLLYLSDSDMPVAAVAAWRSLEWHVKLLSAQRAQLLPCVKQRVLYQNHQSYPLWQGMRVEAYAMPYGGNA
jgi:hypothetical protein